MSSQTLQLITSHRGASFFAADRVLNRMQRTRRRIDARSAMFYFSGLEEWAPSWLGEGLTKSERKAAAAARSFERPTASQVLNNISNLVYSHVALGELSLGGAAQHCLDIVAAEAYRTS